MDQIFSALFLISLLLALAPRVFPQWIPPRLAPWLLRAALGLLAFGAIYALVETFFWVSRAAK